MILQGAVNMPVRQLYLPANIPGLAHDHSYGELSMEDHFLKICRVSEISADECVQIEKASVNVVVRLYLLPLRNSRHQEVAVIERE